MQRPRSSSNPLLRLAWPVLVSVALPLAGCANTSATPAAQTIQAGDYAQAFATAREVLTECGFELERIDASRGVLETRPKQSAGLATPWDQEQTTLAQEWDDFTNDHRRVVRLTFEQPSPEARTGAGSPSDSSAVSIRAEVSVYRLRVPGRRLETKSISLSSRSTDQLGGASESGLYLTPIGRDEQLEARLLAEIAKRTGAASTASTAAANAADPD